MPPRGAPRQKMAEERTLFEGPLAGHIKQFTAAIEMLCAAAPTRARADALWLDLMTTKRSRRCHSYELRLPFLLCGTQFGLSDALYSGVLTLTVVDAPERPWDPPSDFAALPAALGADGCDACLKLTQICFATRLQRDAGVKNRIALPTWGQIETYFNTITG